MLWFQWYLLEINSNACLITILKKIGTQDFNDTKLATECCFVIQNASGCAQTAINFVKKEFHNLILIPSEIILIAELVSAIASTCIIKCNSQKNNYSRI